MKNATLLAGLAAVCTLTAATPKCANCVQLTCHKDASSVVVGGPHPTSIVAARLVLESEDASCLIDIDPATMSSLPGGQFTLTADHGGNCGVPLSVVMEVDDGSGSLESYGICGGS